MASDAAVDDPEHAEQEDTDGDDSQQHRPVI